MLKTKLIFAAMAFMCLYVILFTTREMILEIPVKIPKALACSDYIESQKSTEIAPLEVWHERNMMEKNPVLWYLVKYSDIAVKHRRDYKIPASITLAQGILESGKGQTQLAKDCNNHFGIKCFSKNCKKGHCKNFTDDSHKDFFRVYDSAEDSYEHHAQFLMSSSRYESLFNLPQNDYKGWAKGLSACGYATDPLYAVKLCRIIEKYNLTQYDAL